MKKNRKKVANPTGVWRGQKRSAGILIFTLETLGGNSFKDKRPQTKNPMKETLSLALSLLPSCACDTQKQCSLSFLTLPVVRQDYVCTV
jgi:hypothetical protein